MAPQIDLHEINDKIQLMKKTAEDLNRIGEDCPQHRPHTGQCQNAGNQYIGFG
jgi:hypothetical protein